MPVLCPGFGHASTEGASGNKFRLRDQDRHLAAAVHDRFAPSYRSLKHTVHLPEGRHCLVSRSRHLCAADRGSKRRRLHVSPKLLKCFAKPPFFILGYGLMPPRWPSGKVMRDSGWLTRFVERLKELVTAIQTGVLAPCISVDQVLERVAIILTRRHISGRPAFRKPSTKWSRTDASRSGWELSQWPIVK